MFSWGQQKKKPKWPFNQPSFSTLRGNFCRDGPLIQTPPQSFPVPPASPGWPRYPPILPFFLCPSFPNSSPFSFSCSQPLLFSGLQKSPCRWANIKVCLPKGVCVCVHSRVWLLRPHKPQPARLLCPWNFPGKNSGVGCHFLLQGIFLNQGSNLPL